MVVAKDGKRKRKILPPAPPPQPVPSAEASSPELPKRTKVQAQRKFAQGHSAMQCGLIVSGSPASSTAISLALQTAVAQQQQSGNSTSSSGTMVVAGASTSNATAPNTDVTVAQDLIPNHCPDTDDFLTYLCYRGSKGLPPHLDIFKQAKKSTESIRPANLSTTRLIERPRPQPKLSLPKKAESLHQTATLFQISAIKKKAIDKTPSVCSTKSMTNGESSKKFIPFAVRKNADTALPDLTKRQKLVNEAIRKQKAAIPIKKRRGRQPKSQVDDSVEEDVLPVAHAADAIDLPKTDATPLELNTTMSSAQNAVNSLVEVSEQNKTLSIEPVSSASNDLSESAQNIAQPLKIKGATPTNKRKSGTITEQQSQSGQSTAPQKDIKQNKSEAKAQRNEPPKNNARKPTPAPETSSSEKDIIKTLRSNQPKKKDVVKKSSLQAKDSAMDTSSSEKDTKTPPKRVTRRNAANYLEEDDDSSSDNLPAVVTIPNKKAATSIRSSKTSLSTSSKNQPILNVTKKSIESFKKKPAKEDVDFSSDDDRPLLMTAAQSKSNTQKDDTQKMEESSMKPPTSKPSSRLKKPPIPVVEEPTDTPFSDASSERSAFKVKAKDSKQLKKYKNLEKSSQNQENPESNEVATNASKKKSTNNPAQASSVCKKGPNLNSSNDLSQTDHSEVDTRRPMRKTKEAATIYMELIGQKLNLGASDDDNDSMDSFPELPNVRKTQQMENEMKNEMTKANNTKAVSGQAAAQKKASENPKNIIAKRGRPKKSNASPEKVEPVSIEKVESEMMESSDMEDSADIKKSVKKIENKKRGRKAKLQNRTTSKDEKSTIDKCESKSEYEPPRRVRRTKNTSPKLAVVNKSFSDSDDEPLAVIINKQLNTESSSGKSQQRGKGLKSGSTYSSRTGKANAATTKEESDPTGALLLPPPPPRPPPSDTFRKPSDVKSSDEQQQQPGKLGSVSLLPSKEESQKIFGIAKSVTLAQSSGPNDTKCTLGKCGSVHKTSLGPVVPTEAFLGENLSLRDRRKAKVNMTHEQIQKWLTECPMPAEPVFDDIGEFDIKTPIKPISYLTGHETLNQSPVSSSGLSKHTRTKHASGSSSSPVTVSSARGPSLKAKPVVAMKKRNLKYNFRDDDEDDHDREEDDDEDEDDDEHDKDYNGPKTSRKGPVKVPVPVKQTKKEIVKPVAVKGNTKTKLLSQSTIKNIPEVKVPVKPSPIQPAPPPVPSDKKSIFNQRRTPVYRQESKTPVKQEIDSPLNQATKTANTFKAFSPENEPSIYSFDKEQDDVVAPTPFRRQSTRRESNNSRKDDDSKERTPVKLIPSTIPSALIPDDGLRSIPLAFESPQSKQQIVNTIASANGPIEIRSPTAAEANNDDSDSGAGHTFYIPLQTTGLSGSVLTSLATAQGSSGKSDESIQGVAVKLSTEGPEGPNQRVIMHAKLVTKAQMDSANATVTSGTALPAGIQDVNELVKSVINNMGGTTKSVPIGTVQPRFKSSDSQTSKSAIFEPPQSSCSSTQGKPLAGSSKISNTESQLPLYPSNNTAFPHRDDPSQMVDAPTFAPSDDDFKDPIQFIERIAPIAARFGLCRIIPPASFKPECRISDDMRFNVYNQYVHKMLHRWGPSTKEFYAIKKYLATQSISLTRPPFIGGMEVDLPRLYHTVQELGGLKDVIEKKKWARVAEEMCIPKSAQDRVTKLDDIYCKYLLPYDTLSSAERQKLFDEVEADWAKREAKARRNADRRVSIDNMSNESEDDEEDDDNSDASDDDGGSVLECIVKGRNMALNAFYRIARNTMALWFKNTQEATSAEIEAEFWRHVAVRDSHVCVNSASVDSGSWGYGFPDTKIKGSLFARHLWNLKILTNNNESVLKALGPIMGVTVPTIHLGMLFSACCWYRDPHGLPWIEYLHTGANKIWYSVPDEQSGNFRTALSALVPTHCQNKTIWLPSDTAMVPPHMLTDRGVSLCRTEQQPGQFVVVFPRAYTSSVCTGYSVSESVYFATNKWLLTAQNDFKDLRDSREPPMFPLEELLFSIAQDVRATTDIMIQILPMIDTVYHREIDMRQKLNEAGVTILEKTPPKHPKKQEEDKECAICREYLYTSMVKTDDSTLYCLPHALKYIEKGRIESKKCRICYKFTTDEIKMFMDKMIHRVNNPSAKYAKKKAKKRAY